MLRLAFGFLWGLFLGFVFLPMLIVVATFSALAKIRK